MNKLYYLGQPEDGFGWGVANTNLIAALKKHCEVITCPRTRKNFDAPLFAPVAHPHLKPDVKWTAPRILGYCFTEWPLPDEAKRHARIYDLLFAGSTWNVERLKAVGIKHVAPLLQGVDYSRFTPQPPSERKGFVVFSGGKYEYRKGQDYVLAAMRQFMKQHADVTLIAAWHNQWQESINTMANSWLIDPKDPWLDLPEDRCHLLPPIPNANTPAIYAQAHIGVFPNRCEAGTNLVMSEFMACERPVIASYATGHTDVLEPSYRYLLKNGSYDPAGWFNPNVSDIITHLEHAYNHRDELAERAKECRKMVERLTWETCAERIYKAAFTPDFCGHVSSLQAADRGSESQALAAQ